MELSEENFDRREMVLWDMLKSLTDVKDCVEKGPKFQHDELKCLQNQLMEASEWLKKYTTE